MNSVLKFVTITALVVVIYLVLKRFPRVFKRVSLIALTPVLLLVPVIAFIRYFTTILTNPDKSIRIAVGFDQLCNVALNGVEDETISSRAYRAMREGRVWGCVLCKFLDIFEKDHCEKSEGV